MADVQGESGISRIVFNMPRLFCPKCSSVKDVIPIEYGLPGVEMMEEGDSPEKSALAAA